MAETALVTGASGGIGLEIARRLAAEGYDLVLSARSEDRLKAVAEELQTECKVLPSDLSEPGAGRKLWERIDGPIDALVNNAGFADFGEFWTTDLDKAESMLRLNIEALTTLTRLALPSMVERGSGHVLNVASTAAFQPGPLMAVYYATKAYVLSFSEALDEELAGTGIRCTCLCPGPTESDFQSRALMTDSKLMSMNFMSAKDVAEAGVRGMLEGQRRVIPGFQNQVSVFFSKIAPRDAVTKTVKSLQERKVS